MLEAVQATLRSFWAPDFRRSLAVLIFLACLNPLTISGATSVPGGIRGGLSCSKTRPLTTKQQTVLLKGLRRWTGFAEIHFDDDGFLVLGNRSHILGGSAKARALVSAVVDSADWFMLEGCHQSPQVAFARIEAKLDYVNLTSAPRLTRHSWSIAIDFYDYQELRGQMEAINAFDPALNLLHELAHAVMNLRDSTSESDALGECERYVNQIRRELGLAERESYVPAKEQAVTPFGTGQRVLGELTFVRINPGKRTKKFRLTFDVENVFAATPVKTPSPRVLARR